VKNKKKVDLFSAIFLIIIGVILLLFPLFDVTNIKWIFFGIMLCYAMVHFIQFFLTKKEKDYEGLFTALVSLVVGVVGIVFNFYVTPLKIAISLMVWVALLSLIKLKKADYYHDKKNSMWKIQSGILIMFITVGILTSVNLYYGESIQVLILGFFFFTHGIIELIDPVVQYYVGVKS